MRMNQTNCLEGQKCFRGPVFWLCVVSAFVAPTLKGEVISQTVSETKSGQTYQVTLKTIRSPREVDTSAKPGWSLKVPYVQIDEEGRLLVPFELNGRVATGTKVLKSDFGEIRNISYGSLAVTSAFRVEAGGGRDTLRLGGFEFEMKVSPSEAKAPAPQKAVGEGQEKIRPLKQDYRLRLNFGERDGAAVGYPVEIPVGAEVVRIETLGGRIAMRDTTLSVATAFKITVGEQPDGSALLRCRQDEEIPVEAPPQANGVVPNQQYFRLRNRTTIHVKAALPVCFYRAGDRQHFLEWIPRKRTGPGANSGSLGENVSITIGCQFAEGTSRQMSILTQPGEVSLGAFLGPLAADPAVSRVKVFCDGELIAPNGGEYRWKGQTGAILTWRNTDGGQEGAEAESKGDVEVGSKVELLEIEGHRIFIGAPKAQAE